MRVANYGIQPLGVFDIWQTIWPPQARWKRIDTGHTSSTSYMIDPAIYGRMETTSEPNISVWLYELLGRHTYLSDLVSDLRELLLEEDEEEDSVQPTLYALQTTLTLILAATTTLRYHFPRGAVTSDEAGGIRIEWTTGHRSVRLIVPGEPTGQQYLYHEEGDVYGVDKNVSPTILANWLDRLNQ